MSEVNNSLAAKRVAKLLDENSFMEIGSMVTSRSTDFNLTSGDTPSDGVITGHGLIDGNLVFVYSQDASVLGGTIGEMHARKIASIYDMAMKMGAPVIGLLDCAGVRLQESMDALDGLGQIIAKETEASGVVPQITAVFGNCGGGLSVVPALSDFSFMEEKGKLFVNAPNTIDGNRTDKCDTSSASYQAEETGVVDGFGTEDEILAEIRELVTILPSNNGTGGLSDDCEDDLNRACESMDTMKGDAHYVISEIADDHIFVETKKDFAKGLVTGFIRLNGTTVGVVANNSQIHDENGNLTDEFKPVFTHRGVDKATELVSFCDAFEIPVLTITNVKGYKATMCTEKHMAKALARLTYAFANASVPKVNLIVGDAYGSAYVNMNSKAVGADLVYAWPTAKVTAMDAELAAKILYDGASAAELKEKASEYDALQGSINAAARRGYIDRIVEPVDTRKYLVAAFEMLYTKSISESMKKHGTK
ncbi:MAG: carboxyl transferase [Lachnospiraceae bacterium]|nr:carboxyl transferase [Lachnospiraceae bacterium]